MHVDTHGDQYATHKICPFEIKCPNNSKIQNANRRKRKIDPMSIYIPYMLMGSIVRIIPKSKMQIAEREKSIP